MRRTISSRAIRVSALTLVLLSRPALAEPYVFDGPLVAAWTQTQSGSIYVVEPARVFRFDLKGRFLSSFTAREPSTFAPTRFGIEARSSHSVSYLDDALVLKRRCTLPSAWSWTTWSSNDRIRLVASSPTWGLFDTRTCRLSAMSDAFNRLAGPNAAIVFSPSLNVVAIAPDGADSSTVSIHAYPSLHRLATLSPPPELDSAKYGPASLTAVTDDAEPRWSRRGDPCFGYADGDPLALVPLDGRVFASPASIVIIDEGTPRCTVGADFAERELAHLDLGAPEASLRMGVAEPGRLVVLGSDRIWMVTFPANSGGFDYSAPRAHEVRLGASSEVLRTVVPAKRFVVVLGEHRAWIVPFGDSTPVVRPLVGVRSVK